MVSECISFPSHQPASHLSIREKVVAIEVEMLKREQVEIPVRHYFSPGVYAREITIPKGATVTGKIHKFAQLNILSKGEMMVLTEEGIRHVRAPFTVVSPPGTKRIAHALEECVWTTIHATDETDPAKIESYVVVDTEQQYLEFTRLKLEGK